MTLKQRVKRKPIIIVFGCYGQPVFNTFGLVIGVRVVNLTKWSKPK